MLHRIDREEIVVGFPCCLVIELIEAIAVNDIANLLVYCVSLSRILSREYEKLSNVLSEALWYTGAEVLYAYEDG